MAKQVAVIVGGESLLGKEIHELAGDRFRLRVLGGEEENIAVIEQVEDEPALMATLDKKSLADAELVVLTAASPVICKQAIKWAPKGVPVIDAKGLLDENPGARLYRDGGEKAKLLIIPAAAAQVLADCLITLQSVQAVGHSVVTILEPASEWGQAGVAELQGQAISLLSFKPLKKELFDGQVAFNLLSAFGEESAMKLQEKEARIGRHLASLLAARKGPPLPSIRLVSAPVFHGYTMSLWVEFEAAPKLEKLEAALAKAGVDVRGPSLEPPDNSGIAQQNGYAVGSIHVDRNNPKALWMWLAADNVRIVANTTVAAMEFAGGKA